MFKKKKEVINMFDLFSYMASLGHYNYMDFSFSINHRGKGHNKKAHKNNYKQKIRNKRRRK